MRYILYTIFFCLPLSMLAQDIISQATIDAFALEQKGKTIEQLETLASSYQRSNDWDAYFQIGVLISSEWLAQEEDKKAINSAEQYIATATTKKYKKLPLSLLYKNVGKGHYNLYEDREARIALQEALSIREAIDNKDPELAKDYSNMGVVSSNTGRYNQAIEYLKKGVKLQKDEIVLANIYTEIGINYRFLGDFRKSLDYQSQAIQILENTKEDKALAIALLEKGTVLTELNQNNMDRNYIYDALERFVVLNDRYNQMISYKQLAYSYMQFAESGYIGKDGFDSAIVNYTKALVIAQKDIENSEVLQSQLTMDLASAYTSKKEVEKAAAYILKLSGDKEINQYELNNVNTELHIAKGDIKAATNATHFALVALVEDYNDTNPLSNPSIAQLKKGTNADLVQNALAFKARVLYQHYKQHKETDYLRAAMQTMELFDEIINHIRADFANSGSNVAWSDLTLDAYENAIEICLALEQDTKEDKYKNKAFYFSEKSKGLGLLEAFQNTKAEQLNGLNTVAERELKLDIAELDQTIFQLEQKGGTDNLERIGKLKKEQFLKKERYQDMLEKLEQDNPTYYNTKYNLDIMDVAGVRRLLQPNQALIEYFVGDSATYAFKISADAFEVITLSGNQSMGEKVYNFREAIYGYFLHNKDRNPQVMSKYATMYVSQAYELHQQLIAPLGELPNRLIIIPAGAMCDMPFESLISEPVSKPEAFQSHAYLVKKHSINYAYSATLLQEMMDKTIAKGTDTYLAFAPSFGNGAESLIRGQKYTLSPLTYNTIEVQNIQKLLGEGQIYEGRDATEEQFKEVASRYSILHFATHGLANNQDPDYSLLAFTEIKDDIENEFLYVRDLYNMDLNADLVVLSACETALGKNFRGEGIMSLARGFSYAGAKSIFTTLWSVNDQATYQIVERFYINLQKGMEKDVALQQAKIHFIESSNDKTANPFLWSPYIMIGDTASLPSITKSNIPWGMIGIGAGVLLVLGGIGFAIKKKKIA